MKTIKTTWEVREYDVWGNEEDGWTVNDSYVMGEVELRVPIQICNKGTAMEFTVAYPTDTQIREALGLREDADIEVAGDDTTINVDSVEDGCPLGELHCTSHKSLSPIREKA